MGRLNIFFFFLSLASFPVFHYTILYHNLKKLWIYCAFFIFYSNFSLFLLLYLRIYTISSIRRGENKGFDIFYYLWFLYSLQNFSPWEEVIVCDYLTRKSFTEIHSFPFIEMIHNRSIFFLLIIIFFYVCFCAAVGSS